MKLHAHSCLDEFLWEHISKFPSPQSTDAFGDLPCMHVHSNGTQSYIEAREELPGMKQEIQFIGVVVEAFRKFISLWIDHKYHRQRNVLASARGS